MSLPQLLLETMSANPAHIKQAEQALMVLERQQPDFGLALLTIVSSASSPGNMNSAAAMPAAILFKNFVKRNWVQGSEMQTAVVAEQQREAIKNMLVQLMCSTPPAIQRQVSEAVSLLLSLLYFFLGGGRALMQTTCSPVYRIEKAKSS